MRVSLFLLAFFALFTLCLQFQVFAAAPAGPLIKHLSSLLKWTSRPSSKIPQSDGNLLQFEDGYLVETVVEGNELGIVPYKIRVSQDGELFAVDAVSSNIVKITPPLSRYCRARLVAGSFKGHTGHVDGKPSDARFNNPKGVTMDDKGNVYVADISNLAIRKIGEAGVTTIAGGKSNIPGYRDGPSEDAQFSNDFDVIYVRPTCSLLIVDRGNAAIRQISLSQEDCDYQFSSVSTIDIFMVVGAVLIGYAVCILQQGFGSNPFSNVQGDAEAEQDQQLIKEKPSPVVEIDKEDEQAAGWPSFGQLVWDLSKLAVEAVGSIFAHLNPLQFRMKSTKGSLTPLKDSLIMPEDEVDRIQKQRATAHLPETRQVHPQNIGDNISEVKPLKHRSSSMKDPSLLTKHRSSKRHEYAEYYASGEVPPYTQVRSKSQKERTKHRRPEKSSAPNLGGTTGMEQKHIETKGHHFADTRYEHYNIRNKYGDPHNYQ
nr:NHL repeat-containing protein [Ipomoea batatas]